MIPQIPDPVAYGISCKFGFLSPHTPLAAFNNTYYEPWDAIICHLAATIKSGHLAEEIEALPMLDVAYLTGELEFQRAYVILAFLVHGYIWSQSPPREVIPSQVGEPFLTVCRRLGLQPVVSYAGLCLWNWKLHDGNGGFELENMDTVASFTGTKGEAAFYHVPVLIEYYGGHLMHVLLGAIRAAAVGQREVVVEALKETASSVVRMGCQLSKLYTSLDADLFYYELRPFIAGGKGMEEKGLSRGMVFMNSNGEEQAFKLVGGSAIQSSLFPFLDYVFDVVHDDRMFKDMRAYMPGAHREFLDQVARLPSLRAYVTANACDDELRREYDNCIREMRSWRGKHIAVVSKYIVQPARREAEKGTRIMVRDSQKIECAYSEDKEELQGTGGSALIPFLKQAKDDTVGLDPMGGNPL